MLMDEDFQRLWSLLAELSGQLTANREQCEALKRQAEELKKQAIHTGTGYALRRFNVDLSQGECRLCPATKSAADAKLLDSQSSSKASWNG